MIISQSWIKLYFRRSSLGCAIVLTGLQTTRRPWGRRPSTCGHHIGPSILVSIVEVCVIYILAMQETQSLAAFYRLDKLLQPNFSPYSCFKTLIFPSSLLILAGVPSRSNCCPSLPRLGTVEMPVPSIMSLGRHSIPPEGVSSSTFAHLCSDFSNAGSPARGCCLCAHEKSDSELNKEEDGEESNRLAVCVLCASGALFTLTKSLPARWF